MAPRYIVYLYERDEERLGDCLPDYYPTLEAARGAALDEISRVAHLTERHPTQDFAECYAITRYADDDDVDGEVVERGQ